MRLLMVLWSADTRDYTLPGVQVIVQRALEGARPGAIILMHDGGGDRSQTIAALPAIIAGLHKRGLRPVTVPRLMLDDPAGPGTADPEEPRGRLRASEAPNSHAGTPAQPRPSARAGRSL